MWMGSTTEEAMPGAPILIQVKAAVEDPSKCQVWQLCHKAMCTNQKEPQRTRLAPGTHLSEGVCCMLYQHCKLESGMGLPSMWPCCRETLWIRVWAYSLVCCQSSKQASDQAKQQRNIFIFVPAPRHGHSMRAPGCCLSRLPLSALESVNFTVSFGFTKARMRFS